ncbi:GNAT family N-acetyltransferase [Nocardia sp. NPDC020380]|uniref:GNAT family N-acetyltransferase n=1 Tax=Nocardia sp. NPDC020380 TaxID=3364309 RepID=UPI0037A867A5
MSEPNFTARDFRQCLLPSEQGLPKHAWVAVDDHGNVVSVVAVIPIDSKDPRRVKECALYTTPSRRRQMLAKDLLRWALDDLAAKEPAATLEWTGIATPTGYLVAKSLGLSISDEESAKLGEELDRRLDKNPDDEHLRSLAAFREDCGGRLPYNPFNQEKADQDGRQALRDAAQALSLQVIEET